MSESFDPRAAPAASPPRETRLAYGHGLATLITLLGVVVIINVANLLLSLRGSGFSPRDIGLRFVGTSAVLYLVVILTFLPIAAGFLALLAGLIVGPRGGGLQAIHDSIGLEPIQEIAPKLVSLSSSTAERA